MRHKRRAIELGTIAALRGLQRSAAEESAVRARQERERRSAQRETARQALDAADRGWAGQLALRPLDPAMFAAWSHLIDREATQLAEAELALDRAARAAEQAAADWQQASARDEASKALARTARRTAARADEERGLLAIEDRATLRSLGS